MNEQQHARQTSMEDILFQYATYIWMYALKSGTPDEEREFYAITRLRAFLYDSKLITEDEALKLDLFRDKVRLAKIIEGEPWPHALIYNRLTQVFFKEEEKEG